MNDVPPLDAEPTPYAAFLKGLGREPSADECQRWAAEHAGTPEEPRALVDVGWLTARGGGNEQALTLFHRAAGFAGEFGRDAQVGIVDQLYTLRRGPEAEQAQRALRAELDAQPAGLTDLRVFDDMVEVLTEAGASESALEWCQAGLDRAARAGDAPEAAEYRRGLALSRSFLRSELDIQLDEDDLAVEAEANASLAAFSELVRTEWGSRLDVPVDAEAFDSIVLRWTREDFAAVRAHWPESTAHYSDDYDTYAARIQREARGYDEAGAAHVRMVTGTLADFQTYTQRTGSDPADQRTRQNYGEWRAAAYPEQTLPWPPARNGPCWCDSGRKYKKCCGTPAKN
ncbi:SEC-C domain-containing protein [Streptomyces sp. ISL-100]|uniref:SEC-C domain-containing protein n=1 Tax=Streptomyces sp. ISL-100 TaxID=2819173 RepID=UPI001BE5A5BC|nr:SEC-C domain-containing protein [Streptomyces sp. ISL-100]MBT2401020.1 SEC-C domain-containing protein [Streptomyces sp. ISL-100]